LLLRETLNELRDIIFTRLRKNNMGESHDRERENRGDQERC
jgi:hypothetical protein